MIKQGEGFYVPIRGERFEKVDRPFVVALTLVAALTATGCAGKLRRNSAQMCQAHGGLYSASAKTCTYQPSTRTAKETCEAHGGYYESTLDICEIGRD
jgi:hypothetical protein